MSFIRESFNSHNSAFNKENDPWKEFEKEFLCLVSVPGVRILFNNIDELGKVPSSSVSGVLVAFIICGGSGNVLSVDVSDVWSTFVNVLKESRPCFFISMFCLTSSLTKLLKFYLRFRPVFMM